ncbi:MAG: hypothetical protein QXD66_00660 [Candidatus Nezhaarchaeales archaeon]|nr:MAG: hypothetical protein DSO06_04785 [Candidatus Nezhaarchaeota archaeon WYZ-LMO8]TDA35811.1 MAG: hypothetical protein DSO05_04705 [Candidatus Nezhaarchaeota archaeon WYZ-LMO7]
MSRSYRGYVRGRYAEERLVAKLTSYGWIACRTPMSGSTAQVDVEAIKPSEKRLALIEVKSTLKNSLVIPRESIERLKSRYETWYKHLIEEDWRVEYVLAVLWRVKNGRGTWVLKDISEYVDEAQPVTVKRKDSQWTWKP